MAVPTKNMAVLKAPDGIEPKSRALPLQVSSEDNGELCFQSAQCKSKCCHRNDGLSLARCASRAAENQECSPLTLYGTYYRCPCESGLHCDTDITIGGSITNTNFGICTDRNEKSVSD
ncbi:COL Colipase, partial [Polypterus senegalus]|nr:COL Colipase [Polypterus senegalus]